MEDPGYADIVVGRAFVILRCKSSDVDEPEWQAAAETDPCTLSLVELPRDSWPGS